MSEYQVVLYNQNLTWVVNGEPLFAGKEIRVELESDRIESAVYVRG